VIVGLGQGPGLSDYVLGQAGGASAVTLLVTEIPAHTHGVPASAAAGHGAVPGPAYALGSGGRGSQPAYVLPPEQMQGPAFMAGTLCGSTGGSQTHNNLMPYQVLNYVIAMIGIYPARS
jgi:microcystin-dependent protein